jgi:hypothetical protein
MTAFLTVAALSLASIGLGVAALAPFSLLAARPIGERIALGFGTGLGLLGWLLFFPGIAGWMSFYPIMSLGIAGMVLGAIAWHWLGPAPAAADEAAFSRYTPLLLAALAVVLFQDVLEAMAPPADADSLHYHFALPKLFVGEGIVSFVPRAITGAIPMLLHMSYSAAYALGGEGALTGWTMITGWMAGWIFFVFARRHLSRDWALAAALVFLTTPAMLYGAGTGQVEARIAMFVLISAFAAAEAIRTGNGAEAALAGATAGFYAAAKYMGLLFCAVAGLSMLAARNGIKCAALFFVAMLLAGGQWYLWNWLHTGDPTFPVLFTALNLPDSDIWTRNFDAWYRSQYIGSENPVPHTIWSFLAFPFFALIGSPPQIEAGRSGYGPLPLLLLPFMTAGLWQFRKRLFRSPLAITGLIALAFCILWFWSGSTQRVRHILPVYPLALLCLLVLAQRWAARNRVLPLIASGIGLTIAVQMGAQALQTWNYLPHAFGVESREAFLARNANFYPAARWINQNLGPKDKVLTSANELIYQIDVPVYHAHPVIQALIDLSPGNNDPALFLRQVHRLSITHIVLTGNVDVDGSILPEGRAGTLGRFVDALLKGGCLELAKLLPMQQYASRTLSAAGLRTPQTVRGAVYRLRGDACAL